MFFLATARYSSSLVQSVDIRGCDERGRLRDSILLKLTENVRILISILYVTSFVLFLRLQCTK